jgi:hypothetical protein
MKVYLGIAIALTLAIPAAASAATVPVNQLSGNFAGTNPSVASTNDGVQFGPYADGGSTGGSLYYSGFNGHTLGEISALSYVARYNVTTSPNTVAAPHVRVFLNGDADDVIFAPNTQPVPQTDENVDNAYDVVAGTVRYDDDPGNFPDQPWATVKAAHATEVVSGIYVSAGFSAGDDLSAMLTHLGVNADDFCFSCAPPPVVVVGAAGRPGASVSTTTATPSTAASTVKQTCSGDSVRKLHAPKRRGQRFLTTRATLRGKALRVRGREITAT